MKKLLQILTLGLLFTLPLPPFAKAQLQYLVVQTCGTQSLPVNARGVPFMDATGNACTSATSSGGSSNVSIVGPLGHATVDTAAVSVVPSATATFPATQATAANLNMTATQPTAANLNMTAVQPTAANLNMTCANCSGSTIAPAGFTPNGNYATLAVTSASANVALPAGGGTAVAVSNTGSQTAFVNFGTSGAVTAATTNIPIAGGQTIAFTIGVNTFIAGITSAPNATNLTLAGGAGAYSGTGGSVTLSAPANDVSAGPSNFTGAGTLVVNAQGAGSTGIIVSGTFTGAAWTVQGSVDGTNYVAIPFFDNTAGGNIFLAQPGATTTGQWVAPTAGYKSIRLNVSAVSTGTLVASLNASAGSAQRPVGTVGDNANITGVAGTAVQFDPCTWKAKTNLAISTNATALTQIIAASGSTKIYVCSIMLSGGVATAFNLITGTGTNCGSTTAAFAGSTTAANGIPLSATGGFSSGNGGATTLGPSPASSELCTLQSNAAQVSGWLTYVQQ